MVEYFLLERVAGVEPASSVWKTEIITVIRYPLDQDIIALFYCADGGWILSDAGETMYWFCSGSLRGCTCSNKDGS